MKKKIKYSKGEMGEVEVMKNFLPLPKDLVLKNDSVKITISLSKDSVDFFKSQASANHSESSLKLILGSHPLAEDGN